MKNRYYFKDGYVYDNGFHITGDQIVDRLNTHYNDFCEVKEKITNMYDRFIVKLDKIKETS